MKIIPKDEYKEHKSLIDSFLSKRLDSIRTFQEIIELFPEQIRPQWVVWEAVYYAGINSRELLREVFPNKKPKPLPPLTFEEIEAEVDRLLKESHRERQRAIDSVKLTPNDRLQATLRSETYKKDFDFVKEHDFGNQLKMTQRLKEKWKLPKVIDPYNPLSPYFKISIVLHPTGAPGYLDISINLSERRASLIKAFEELLDEHLQVEKTRDKKSKYKHDHWYVYDKVNGIPPVSFGIKKNMAELARELCVSAGDVNSDPEVNKVYQAVEYAYNQAKKAIARVEAEAGPPFSGWSIF